jgi:hypothetical protein
MMYGNKPAASGLIATCQALQPTLRANSHASRYRHMLGISASNYTNMGPDKWTKHDSLDRPSLELQSALSMMECCENTVVSMDALHIQTKSL